MANQKNIAIKAEKVKQLQEVFNKSTLVVLCDYKGTTVEQDTKIRKDLRAVNAKDTVIKNNIIKRALDGNKVEGLDDVLVGPTTVITTEEDYLTALKAVYKFSKENENYKIKGGLLEGKVMTADELVTLAKLPSREELLSKLASSLLQTISKLAVAIDQVKVKKESENA